MNCSTALETGASSCSQLTLAQAKALPGWPQIVQYAKDTYGDDGLTYKVNPPGQPDYQAVVCTDQEQLLLISMQGASSCSTRNDTVAGSITGTTGSVTLSHIDTYSGSGTWTITESSSLAIGSSLTVQLGIPIEMSVSTGVTTTGTFENKVSKSFQTKIDSQRGIDSTFNVGANENCTATLLTTTCTGSGAGAVHYNASGWVWLYYDEKKRPKSQPKAEGHYQWAVRLESVIKDVNDRSSNIQFTGYMGIDSHAVFKASCVPIQHRRK